MNCQSCGCSLVGLHSYGKTLEENFCCVCWHSILDGGKNAVEVISAFRKECAGAGINLKGDEDLETLQASLEERRDELETLLEKIEEAKAKGMVTA